MSKDKRLALMSKLDALRRNLATEIVQANDCGENQYAERLAEIDTILFECEEALRS